jgi:hypothetical protein
MDSPTRQALHVSPHRISILATRSAHRLATLSSRLERAGKLDATIVVLLTIICRYAQRYPQLLRRQADRHDCGEEGGTFSLAPAVPPQAELLRPGNRIVRTL